MVSTEASLPAEALRRRRTRVATAVAVVLTILYFGRQVALELMLEAYRSDALLRSRYIGYSLGPLLLALLVVTIAAALPGRNRLRLLICYSAAVAVGLLTSVWLFFEVPQIDERRESARRFNREVEILRLRINQVTADSRQVEAALAREPALAAAQLQPLANIDRSVERLLRRAALAEEHAALLDQLDELAPRSGQALGPKRRRVANAQVGLCRSMAGALQVLRNNEQAWKLEGEAPSFISQGPESAEFARQIAAGKASAAELAAALEALDSAVAGPDL